jgi:hypothetical protein
MSIRKELINLTIINNSDCSLTIPLFQNNVASINATTKYSWDITTADLSCGFGSIIINSITYNITFDATLTGLLSSLNGLGFGYFCSEIILGQLYVYTVDDTNIYGDLDLCPTPTTSTTTTTTTPIPTTTTTTSSTTTTTTGVPTTTTTSTTTTTTTLVGILASFEGQVTANVIASGSSTADAQIDVNGISTNIDVAISQSGAGSSSITQPPTGVIQQILYLGDIINFNAINTVGGSMTYSYQKFTTEDGTTVLQSGTSITAYAYTITATDLTKTNLKFTNIVTATSA